MAVLAGWGDEEHYVNAILARFASRIPAAKAFALSRRVVLVRAFNGKDVDIRLVYCIVRYTQASMPPST